MGLLSVLNVGTRGLMASQLAMDVAGQNISNADVEGYSRKRLNLNADYRYDSTYGQMGIGVEVINIERMRSAFIDTQIQNQNQQVGYYEETDYSLKSIENVLNEPGDTGILAYIDQFFDSWQNLSDNPSNISARNMVKTNTEILTDVFHNVAGELADLQQTRNEEIVARVDKVNTLCTDIYNLNQEIAAVELGNQNANDSRDKRDMMLKELSNIIDIDVVENDLGQITVTTSGNIIVSPAFTQQLETVSKTFSRSDGSSRTEVGVRFANSKNAYDPKGGQLKGLIDSRDKIIPGYQEQIDKLARELVKNVNDLHRGGYSLSGYTGIPFFDETTTGALDIELGAAIISDVNNIAAASGGEMYPAEQNVSAAGAHDFGTVQQLYRNPSVPPPTEAHNIVRGTVVVTTSTVTLKEDIDYNIDYTNGTIQMLHAGYDAESLNINFEYRTGGFTGPGDNSNAIAIAQLRSELTMEPDPLGDATVTFGQYYSSVIGVLGLNKNESASNLETRQYLVEQYKAQQDSISGVSLDEEMADIIKFQHTYQAAARIITTADEMLDVLMNI